MKVLFDKVTINRTYIVLIKKLLALLLGTLEWLGLAELLLNFKVIGAIEKNHGGYKSLSEAWRKYGIQSLHAFSGLSGKKSGVLLKMYQLLAEGPD